MGAGFSIKAKGSSEAEILIYEDVGEGWFGGVTAKQFAEDLKAVGKVDTINLRINSAGGDVFDGLAIYRRLVDHPAKVITHIDGLAASIASVIAMSGDEIRISESGFLMIHNAWGVAIGSSEDMRTMASLLETTTSAINDVYAARTKNKAALIKSWMDSETWFTAADAVKEGFADSVAANMRVAAHIDNGKHKFKRAPSALTGRPALAKASESIERMRSMVDRFRGHAA